MVDTFGTSKIAEEQIEGRIRNNFRYETGEHHQYTQFERPIYKKTAAYGHFGRNDPSFVKITDRKYSLLS